MNGPAGMPQIPLHETAHGPVPTPETATAVARLERDEIRRRFGSDPWLANILTGLWEHEHGVTVLESVPWHMELKLTEDCNARCTFCGVSEKHVTKDRLDELEVPIRHARSILVGGGEPLAYPHLRELLDRFERWADRRVEVSVLTNGVFLLDHLDALLAVRTRHLRFSVNAASPDRYREVVGLSPETFNRVLEGIREAVRRRDSREESLRITIVMVVVRENIADAAAFVRLGNELAVDHIVLGTLLPSGERDPRTGRDRNHPQLPSLQKNFGVEKRRAVEAISRSRVPVDADPDAWDDDGRNWDTDAGQALDENTFACAGTAPPEVREPPVPCRAPYHHLTISDCDLRLSPCKFMYRVPGYPMIEGPRSWNDPALRELRRLLREGPLPPACRTCPNNY